MSNWSETKIDLNNVQGVDGKEYDASGLGVPDGYLSDYYEITAEISTGGCPDMMIEIYDGSCEKRKSFVNFVISPQSARLLAQALLLHANAIEHKEADK